MPQCNTTPDIIVKAIINCTIVIFLILKNIISLHFDQFYFYSSNAFIVFSALHGHTYALAKYLQSAELRHPRGNVSFSIQFCVFVFRLTPARFLGTFSFSVISFYAPAVMPTCLKCDLAYC